MGYLGSLLKATLLTEPIFHLLDVQTLMMIITLFLVMHQASQHLRAWQAGKHHSRSNRPQ